MKFLIGIILICSYSITYAQTDTLATKFEKDTNLVKILKIIPEANHYIFIKEYMSYDEEGKKAMIKFFSAFEFLAEMPKSSKKELIANIDKNYTKIIELIRYYKKIIPPIYKVYIEFNPYQLQEKKAKTIDFRVFKKQNDTFDKEIFQEHNIELNTPQLDNLLKKSPLNRQNLQELKSYLEKANCISIENTNEYYEIGFARSGLGKYYYLIFNKPLTLKQIDEYNDKCEHIYYKGNIVLMYGGPAFGSACFPDE